MSGSDKVELHLYYSQARSDNMTVANGQSISDAVAAGYSHARTEAKIFKDYKPGLVPLRLYYSPTQEDHISLSTTAALNDVYATATNYQFLRLEGWVYPTQQPGTVPLYLYWSAARNDNFVTATAQGIFDAEQAGYTRVRVEGYAFP